MTALVPSETACLESSPGSIKRTAVWISREESVAFLLSLNQSERKKRVSVSYALFKTKEAVRLRAVESNRETLTSSKLAGFGGNALKDIVNEGVHNGHALLGDTGIGVDLFQDLVDVRGVRLDTLLGFGGSRGLLGGCRFLGGLLGRSLGHL